MNLILLNALKNGYDGTFSVLCRIFLHGTLKPLMSWEAELSKVGRASYDSWGLLCEAGCREKGLFPLPDETKVVAAVPAPHY